MPDLSVFSPMIETLSDPRQLHAILVHTPIAVACLGTLGAVVLLCTGGRSHALRWAVGIAYLLAAVMGWYAAEAGEMSVVYEHAPTTRTAEALSMLERHEKMGDVVPLMLAITGVVVICTAFPMKLVRVPLLVLGLLISVGTLGWVGLTAHSGGQLVYEHGVNTPLTANNAIEEPQPGKETRTTAAEPETTQRKKGFFGLTMD